MLHHHKRPTTHGIKLFVLHEPTLSKRSVLKKFRNTGISEDGYQNHGQSDISRISQYNAFQKFKIYPSVTKW